VIRVLCESYRNPCSPRRAVEGESKAIQRLRRGLARNNAELNYLEPIAKTSLIQDFNAEGVA